METIFSLLINILPLVIVFGVISKMLGISFGGGKKGKSGGLLGLILSPIKAIVASAWRGITRVVSDIHGYLFGKWPGAMTLVYILVAGIAVAVLIGQLV